MVDYNADKEYQKTRKNISNLLQFMNYASIVY